MIICESCYKKEANMNVTYGLFNEYKNGRPHPNFNLCSECSNLLLEGGNSTDGLKKLVTVGLCYYLVQAPVKRVREELYNVMDQGSNYNSSDGPSSSSNS